jgi:hypothetical protein
MIVDHNANATAYPQSSDTNFNASIEDAPSSSPHTGSNTGGCVMKLTQGAHP